MEGLAMTRWKLMFVLLVLTVGSAATAQPPVGSHDGLWIGMFNLTAGKNPVLQLDSTTNNQTAFPFQTAPSSPWPYWGNPFGAAIFPDNHDLAIPSIVNNPAATIGVGIWDPTIKGNPANPVGITGTYWAGLLTNGPLMNWADWAFDSDGDLITIDNAASPQQAAFFDGKAWSFAKLTGMAIAGGIGGTKWDRWNGGWIHCAWGPPTLVYTSPYDFSALNTRNTGPVSTNLTRYGGDLLENGAFLLSTCCAEIFKYAPPGGPGILSGPTAALNVAFDITTEHPAKPGISVWAAQWNAPYGVNHIDLTSYNPTTRTGHVITKTYAGTTTTMPSSPIEVIPLYTNDLNTQRTGKATWDVNINPGMGLHSGKAYALGVSLTGSARVALGDGRELFLTSDLFTVLGLFDLLKPIVQNTAGKLDGNGTAKAKLDLTLIGPTANGMVVHLAALVLDPSAPSGVAHVCQPWAFVVDVKP